MMDTSIVIQSSGKGSLSRRQLLTAVGTLGLASLLPSDRPKRTVPTASTGHANVGQVWHSQIGQALVVLEELQTMLERASVDPDQLLDQIDAARMVVNALDEALTSRQLGQLVEAKTGWSEWSSTVARAIRRGEGSPAFRLAEIKTISHRRPDEASQLLALLRRMV